MYEIDKEFSFEYGHRVHSQELDNVLSSDSECTCRHIHGHSGRVKVGLSGDELNKEGMVLDFNNLKFFKNFLDEALDHKTIIDINDPLIYLIIPDFQRFNRRNHFFYWTLDTSFINGINKEFYDSFTIVDFVPTSENFCKWLFDVAKKNLDPYNIKVAYVDFYETLKSHSRYSEE